MCETLCNISKPDWTNRHVGIVNFGIDNNGYIQLPEQCFALRIIWYDLQEGNLSPPGNTTIGSGLPEHFKLEFAEGFSISKEELGEHGMKLFSVCL